MLTVAQVFELAERVGRRPVGNVRKLRNRAYRLSFQRHGEMRSHPEVFTTRGDAERALWKMGMNGRADCTQDRRFRALVLLATFASLRWGEVSALRRSDAFLTEVVRRPVTERIEQSRRSGTSFAGIVVGTVVIIDARRGTVDGDDLVAYFDIQIGAPLAAT
ncbi:hypothetical protein [Microtetraspora fusca]|uniref:hypothetical protein n=1 Tax=Microtetraspora fusca TaxID=1997 RepID=UPI00082C812C|nr:hypothetical protein [Microtetraspora fusca]